MLLQKPAFLLFYHARAAEASFGEWLGVLWHGLSLDCTVADYVTAFSGTCRAGIVLDSPFSQRVWRIVLTVYFFADRTGDGRDLRRRSQPVRLLGLSARRFGADLPFRSWGGACECQLGRKFCGRF